MNANLILGSSHALPFAAAVGEFEADWKRASVDLIKIDSASGGDNYLLFTTNRPSFLELSSDSAGEVIGAFGPLMDKVRQFNREGSKVIFAIGGNEHNIRFLRAADRPFDFYHPSRPAMAPGRQILPSRAMDGVLDALLQRTLTVTRMIAAELPAARRYYLAPPPPIPSEEQIRANPAIFDFTTHGVEDAGVRLKIYNLYIEIVRSFCAAARIEFIPPVAQHRDDEGYLREAYWEGATHATSDYYRAVVSELGL